MISCMVLKTTCTTWLTSLARRTFTLLLSRNMQTLFLKEHVCCLSQSALSCLCCVQHLVVVSNPLTDCLWYNSTLLQGEDHCQTLSADKPEAPTHFLKGFFHQKMQHWMDTCFNWSETAQWLDLIMSTGDYYVNVQRQCVACSFN